MAFCPSCGSQVEGRFCARCGAAVGAGPAVPPAQPMGGAQPGAAPAAQAGLSENAACALCYVLGLITGVLFLVLAPYNQNRNVRFHAFQSIFFNIAWIALAVGCAILGMILSVVLGSLIGGMIAVLMGLLQFAVMIGFIVVWVLLIVKASQGSRMTLPIIGALAEKQA